MCSLIEVGFRVDKVAVDEWLQVSKYQVLCGWDAGITLNYWKNIPHYSVLISSPGILLLEAAKCFLGELR